MEFRDLGRQYLRIRDSVDEKIREVIESTSFIGGHMVEQLELVHLVQLLTLV